MTHFIQPSALPRPGEWVAVAIFAEKEIQLSEPAIVLRRIHFQSVRGLNGTVALVADAPGWPTLVVRLGSDARLAGTVVGFEGKIVSDTERMAGAVAGKQRIHAV